MNCAFPAVFIAATLRCHRGGAYRREAASVSGRDVPNWGGGGGGGGGRGGGGGGGWGGGGGGGCGAVTLDRWKQGTPGQRGAM